MLEAIRIIKEISGHEVNYSLLDEERSGDHKWYISDVRKFQSHYPDWHFEYDMKRTLTEIIEAAESKR